MMFPRGVAIFAITRQGVKTASKIKDALGKKGIKSQVYAIEKYAQKNVVPITATAEGIKSVFGDVDGIIGVMASGIVVRKIAPLLKSKLSDPAVVCVDTCGKFAISLLSGHYGGANKLAKLVAEGIGATAVITTASEVLGKKSIDELAKDLHCKILNPHSLVGVNSALVNEQSLVLVLSGKVKVWLNRIRDYEGKKTETIEQAIQIVQGFDAGAIISSKEVPKNNFKNVTFLKPKTVVVGIGSRKVVNPEDILELVNCALIQLKIPMERVNRLATVDIKKDSESMLNAVKKMGLSLEFVSVKELAAFSHRDLSEDSSLVQEKIGVGGVCERAALIVAGKNAKLLLKKTKANGVTVAVAEGE